MPSTRYTHSSQSVFNGGQDWQRVTIRTEDDKPIIVLAIVNSITPGFSTDDLARYVASACGYFVELKPEFFKEVPRSMRKDQGFLERATREIDPRTGEIIYSINGHRGIKDDTHD